MDGKRCLLAVKEGYPKNRNPREKTKESRKTYRRYPLDVRSVYRYNVSKVVNLNGYAGYA